MNISSEGIQAAPKVVGPVREQAVDYLAPVYVVPKVSFRENPLNALKGIIPGEFTLGDKDLRGDVRFAFGILPDSLQERDILIEAIRKEGSLSADSDSVRQSLYFGLYERVAAETANVDVKQIVSCVVDSTDLPRIIEEGITTVGKNFAKKLLYHPNLILVYDARERSNNGIKPITQREYTFKNPEQKWQALLAIIRLV